MDKSAKDVSNLEAIHPLLRKRQCSCQNVCTINYRLSPTYKRKNDRKAGLVRQYETKNNLIMSDYFT